MTNNETANEVDKAAELMSVVGQYLDSDNDGSILQTVDRLNNNSKEDVDKDAKEQIHKDDEVEEPVDKKERDGGSAEIKNKEQKEESKEEESVDIDLDSKIKEEHSKLDDQLKNTKKQQRQIKQWRRDRELESKRDDVDAEIRKSLDLSESADIDSVLDYLEKHTTDFIEDGYKEAKEFTNQRIRSDKFADDIYFKQWKESEPELEKEADRFLKEFANVPLSKIPHARLTIARALNSIKIEQEAIKSSKESKTESRSETKKNETEQAVNQKIKVKPRPTIRKPTSSVAVQSDEDSKTAGIDWSRYDSKSPDEITNRDREEVISQILDKGITSFR